MTSLETLTAVLGWSTVINSSMLMIVAVLLMFARSTIITIHIRMSGLNETDLLRAYFQYLSQHKIAIIVFNLVPYIALKKMA